MCITQSLFCIAEMNTILQINYTSIKNNKKLKIKDKKGGHHSMPLHIARKRVDEANHIITAWRVRLSKQPPVISASS